MNEFDITNIVAKPDEQPDPLFTFDGIMGKILNALAVVGMFCAFMVGCAVWGYFQ